MKWIFSKYLPNGSQSEKNVACFFHVHDGEYFYKIRIISKSHYGPHSEPQQHAARRPYLMQVYYLGYKLVPFQLQT